MAISLRVISLSSSRISVVSRHSDDDLTTGPTIDATRAVTSADSAQARTPASSNRFAPGSIIAGRYRLVALLGRGGMGEVYRADDLTLDQPVALKFLPEHVAADASHLAQFHNELRVARQVSHKNVCRLYDLGEADGRRFLTMEYIDGEDLASLLRRIGRIPQDKAIQLARQLCAGVAAAHDRAVLHRDLKPANVMIDGDGNVRITDFGLAVAASDANAVHAGTPQYMAPEQLIARSDGIGPTATVKSDIYALGLVLFEIFTGRRAYEAKTLADLIKAHESGAVATPSSVVRDLDPAVERTIMRCLERDAAKRPASALAVAAALPGGDPLAAALAAGETPSPDVIAAAAETDAIPVGHGLALLAALVASIAVYVVVSPRMTMADLVPLDKAPAVLADRAQQIAAEFGYADAPADTAQSFTIPPDYPRWLAETDQTTNRWNPSRVAKGPALLFWYRTSPRELEPDSPSPAVSATDPAMTLTDMTLVILDTRGRLVEFRRVPPQRDEPSAAAPVAAQWDTAFRAAGLSQASFTPVPPEWAPKDFADVRAAWEGPLADAPDIRVRIEAAAYRGRIVSFYTIGPWALPRAMQPLTQSTTSNVLRIFAGLLWVTVLAAALLLARHNVRANRADRRSAARLGGVFLALQAAAWTIGAHHLASLEEVNSFFRVFGNVVLEAVLLWSLYLALEPYGRRFWPDGLLGWTRLFSGHVRDPRIGREVLIGAALGGALTLLDLARGIAPTLIGRPAGIPGAGTDVRALAGPGGLALSWMDQFYGSVQTAFIVVMVFVALRLIVRRTWIAVVVGVLLVTAAVMQSVPTGGVLWLHGIIQLMTIGTITFAIFRFGLLVTTVMILVDNIPTAVPIVMHGPSWRRCRAISRSRSSLHWRVLVSTPPAPGSRYSAGTKGESTCYRRCFALAVGVAFQGSSGHGCFG
jgi:serine/threonine-protein kinase